uniref:Myb-like domain-containing protein n=1 Tax=Opuntia streptacantha TaxID=393608 RepID=A0A7C9DI25_OPUST
MPPFSSYLVYICVCVFEFVIIHCPYICFHFSLSSFISELSFLFCFIYLNMGKKEGKTLKPTFVSFKKRKEGKASSTSRFDQEFNDMTEAEEDLICRMYRLIGERWDLIAGRIPGRTAEEIEEYWTMRERQGLNHHLADKTITSCHVHRTVN